MTEYVFIGRRRHWGRTLAYGLLTLGIYGRVLLYKQVKEIDGHRALFVDLRLMGFLLVLPILGPLVVKMKLRRLVAETVEADATQPPVRRRALFWLAFVPIIPGFHMVAQHHLNLYWRRQAKIDDLRHKRAELAKLKKGRQTEEKRQAAKRLEERIAVREQALQDEEDAAAAIRDAEEETRRAEAELKQAQPGLATRMTQRLKRTTSSDGNEDDAAGGDDGAEDGGRSGGLVSKLKRRKAGDAPDGGESGPESADQAAEDQEKSDKQAAKERAKAEKKAAKEKAKAEKKAAKEKAKTDEDEGG